MEKILYALSELSLISGIILLLISHRRKNAGYKHHFTIAKFSVLLSIFFTVVFYNKTVFPQVISATPYSAMFYVMCSLTAFIWLSLSYRWFTSMNISAEYFCILSLLAVLSCKLIIDTVNSGVLFGALLMLAVVNYLFLRFSQEAEEFHAVSARYGWSIVFFAMFMLLGLIIITPDFWRYDVIADYFMFQPPWKSAIVIMCILFFLLYLLGVAPLHFGVSDIIAPAVLPVAAYFSLIPSFALWACFINVSRVLGTEYDYQRFYLYTALGCVSLVIGAIGAHTTRNIKKIFSYAGLCQVGILLIVFADFSEKALIAGLVYMQVYLLAILGIYACFYSFKSSREYLNNLSMLNGIASVRPFIAAAMLFFMVSLTGVVPMPGFIGLSPVMNLLMDNQRYQTVIFVLVFVVVMSCAFIRIIITLYFTSRDTDYDRPDKGIYLYLLIILLLYLVLLYEPQFLQDNARLILAAAGDYYG